VNQTSETENRQKFLETMSSTVAWFWNRLNDNTLIMKPPYQRNPVWQQDQKAYFIDSILRGYPVPELYLQTTVSATGEEQHIIVDGQQRVRSCLEFISNQFTLDDDSEKYGDYAGLSFDELGEDAKKQIFQYKFIVRMLPELPDVEIREIFGRLNRNNIALNRQELRNATYWGEFITSMTDLSKLAFWVPSGLFTANDFRRMIDIEYISELATGFLFGPQNKKARLDEYYANFEQEFPDRERVEASFNAILAELSSILEWPTKLRWSRKVDFYSLFLTFGTRVSEMPFTREERIRIKGRLEQFSHAVDRLLRMADEDRSGSGSSKAALAYARGVRNSSDLNSRRIRSAALDAFIREKPYRGSVQDLADPLKSLPSSKELLSIEEEEE
jgi:Protein of unknown function DUF262